MKTDLQDRQVKRRAEILSIATDMFLENGYGRTSMDQVLARVGGSKRTLYAYFPSKEILFQAIVSTVAERVLKSLVPPLSADDPRSALCTMGTEYLTVLLSPEGLALYRAALSEARHFPELAELFFSNGPGEASHRLSEFFIAECAKGQLTMGDPRLGASQFLGMVRGDIHMAAALGLTVPTKPVIKKAVTQAVDSFLTGVSNPKAKPSGRDRRQKDSRPKRSE